MSIFSKKQDSDSDRIRQLEAELAAARAELDALQDRTDQGSEGPNGLPRVDLLQALLKHVPAHVYCKDLSGRFTYSNREIGVGQTDFDVMDADRAEACRVQDCAVMESREPIVDEEEKVAGEDGRISWAITSKSALVNSSDEVVGIIGISRTTTQERETQESLEFERYLMHTLLDNIPDLIYFKDLKSNFLLINHRLTDLLKLSSAEEAVGKSDSDFFDSELSEKYLLDDQAVIASGEPLINIEEESVSDSDELRWLSTSKVPMRNEVGDVIGTCGISRDITELKELDARHVEAIQQLEAALQQVKQLTGLVPICSYCKNIRDDSGYWHQLEEYLHDHSAAELSHGICEECAKKQFPDMDITKKP